MNILDKNFIQKKLLYKQEIKPSPDGRYQDCWYWTGTLNENGYGIMMIKRKFQKVHRISAHIFLDFDLDPNWDVLHSCDNPPCFNPEHLLIGTHQDNMIDMINKNRQAKGERIGSAILTEKQILEIKKLFKEGFTRKQLMEKFNIRYDHVISIIKDKTWRYLIKDNL